MIYCMADLHGERDFFLRMLEQIRFSDTDHLYILGDVIDRGTGGIDLLEQIMEASNMTMLLGNHEQMCLSTLGPTTARIRRGTASCVSSLNYRMLWSSRWAIKNSILSTVSQGTTTTPASGAG